MCCHGRVPSCSSCPCSAPPASANGAKVSGAVPPPLGDCVYLSWAPETPVLMWRTPAVCFSCCFPPPQLLGTLPCHSAAVLQPVSTNQAKPPPLHGISCSQALPQLTLFSPSLLSWQAIAVCCPGQRAALSASVWTRTAPSALTR